MLDVVSRETEDTPIARAAETAVRVLAGRLGEPLPPPPQTRVLTVANQKGGVGKTTTTVNLAAALALQGAQVLVIDLDPQGNASTALGVDHHSEVPSVYDVVVEGRALHEVIAPVEGLDGLLCAPATIDLAGAEIELVSLVARESRLQRALEQYDAWCADQDAPRLDYVLIDCPPSLGLLTVNALVAAPEVLIPIQCEYYALEGVGQLLRNIEMVKSHLNPALHVSTVLLTMYDARTRLAAQVAEEVRTHFVETVLRTTIPRSVRISEAPSYGQTVMTYDPGSTGALSYLEAAREMALRGAGRGAGESLVSKQKRGLGRGLGALIPTAPEPGEPGAPSAPSPVDVLIPERLTVGSARPRRRRPAGPRGRRRQGRTAAPRVTQEIPPWPPARSWWAAPTSPRSPSMRCCPTRASRARSSTRTRWPSWCTPSARSGCCSRWSCGRSAASATS